MSIPRPCLALVTNRALFSNEGALVDAVASAVHGGVNLVIMREKDLPDAAQLSLAQRLRDATTGRALLLINDSVSIALASDADGVQLGESSRGIGSARQAAGDSPLLIGRSVHDEAGAAQATSDGAELLILGNVFETETHPDRPGKGLAPLRWAARAGRVPVIGIGGITAGSAGSVIEAGASGVAVITAILGAPDPEHAARDIASAIGAGSPA